MSQRIAVRSAIGAAIVAAAAGSLGLLFGLFWGLGGVVVLSILIAIVVFMISDRVISVRIEEATEQVIVMRHKQFDRLKPHGVPHGDEIEHLNWQLYRTGQAMEKEIAELRKVEDYRREFLGNVSHELKTPIFAIQGFAETLRDGALDDPSVNRNFIEKIIRNSERLNSLVRDLAEISRIETGQLKMNMEPFRMSRLVTDVIDGLDLKARSRNVKLASNIDPSIPVVVGDVERIRQVLINLVENAIKYTNESGNVEISVAMQEGGSVRVSVKDDGVGIAPQDLPRLTERFYRVDRSRSRDAGGTGLGLSIVKHILAAHGMSLSVASKPGEGSDFSFAFPPESVRGGSTYVRADVLRQAVQR
jgi:two-component system, OmpR family, phosphate regulon sensor histidine kinase PhoR